MGLCDHHEVDSWFKRMVQPLKKGLEYFIGGRIFPLNDKKKKHNANLTKAVFGIDGPNSPYFEGKKNEITIFRQNVLANVAKM